MNVEVVPRGERGVALIITLLSMMLLSALGLALTLTTSTEVRISSAHGRGVEAFYAADAAFDRALHDLSLAGDWDLVLSGAVRSSFVDGSPGLRRLADGTVLDLREETHRLNCGGAPCGPWGPNNPVWQLFAHGPLADMSPTRAINSRIYVVVWVADDATENDGQPLVDGDTTAGANPGEGLLQVLAHAYGPGRARRAIEGTLRRADPRVHVLSWRATQQ
jgi:hypothetical protein